MSLLHFISTIKRLVACLILFLFCGISFSQAIGCDEGVIRLPDKSGTIQICSALAMQVPQLSLQLKSAAKTLGDQQVQIKELTRLIQGMNESSQQIGLDRQAKMLKALSTELTRSQRSGDERVRETLSMFTRQFDDLRVQLIDYSGNRKNNDLQNSLRGDVGDAISKLELLSASRQLEELSIKLNVIEGKVQDVKSDTSEIRLKLLQLEKERKEEKEKDLKFLAEMEVKSKERIAEIKRGQESRVKEINESPENFASTFVFGYSTYPASNTAPIPWGLKIDLRLKSKKWNNSEAWVIGRPSNMQPWFISLTEYLDKNSTREKQEIAGGVWGVPGELTVCIAGFNYMSNKPSMVYSKFLPKLKNGVITGLDREKEGDVYNIDYDVEGSSFCSLKGLLPIKFVKNFDIFRNRSG